MLGRIFFSLTAALAAGLAAVPAQAQTWTAEDVAARARDAAPEVRAALGRARLERARAETAGLLPNPRVEWERQEAFEPNAQEQDLVRLVMPLELGGRPGTRRALAEVEAALAAADAAGASADAVAGALALFYRALALERRATIRQRALEGLDRAHGVIRDRARAGEVAGFDAARLALALELARSASREAELDARLARARLGALLGSAPPDALRGALAPPPPPALASSLASARAARADLAALRRAETAAARARSASEWAWVPRLEITGGYNRQASPSAEGHGYLLLLGAEIPLFDHGQAERAQAGAVVSAVAAQREALRARVDADVRAHRARLIGLLEERARFAEAVAAPLEIVESAAAAGYREGERSVVELLDARRAALDATERSLALELAARRAELALRRASGALR